MNSKLIVGRLTSNLLLLNSRAKLKFISFFTLKKGIKKKIKNVCTALKKIYFPNNFQLRSISIKKKKKITNEF